MPVLPAFAGRDLERTRLFRCHATMLKSVRTTPDFFNLLTLVDAVILFVIGMTGCYLGGLILWRLKRKLEML
jgi:hypothetical protein